MKSEDITINSLKTFVEDDLNYDGDLSRQFNICSLKTIPKEYSKKRLEWTPSTADLYDMQIKHFQLNHGSLAARHFHLTFVKVRN